MFSWKSLRNPLSSRPNADRVLVIAPHPDDESLACAGVIRRAVKNGDAVKIIIIFDGAAYGNAHVRRRETVRAMKLLGVPSRDITFLGFPDGKGLEMWNHKDSRYRGEKYRFALEPRTVFSRDLLLADLKKVLGEFDPTLIYSPNEHDEHGDHQAVSRAVKKALREMDGVLHWKELYSYLIHWEKHDHRWPGKDIAWSAALQENGIPSLDKMTDTHTEVFLPAGFTWSDKRNVIRKYASQLGGADLVLTKFAKTSEIFWLDHVET